MSPAEVSDYLQSYIDRPHRFGQSTLAVYSAEIRRFLEWLDNTPLSEVKTRTIEDYIESSGGYRDRATRREYFPRPGRSPTKWSQATKNRVTSALKSFFSYLVREEIITSNPVFDVERGKLMSKVPRFLKDWQVERLLKTHIEPVECNHCIVALLYYTGIRVSELTGCTIGSLDIKTRELLVLGKGGKERYVRFPQSLVPSVESYLRWRSLVAPKGSTTFFLTSTGQPITRRQVEYLFTKLSKATGIPVHPHILRHTFGTMFRQRGGTLEQVKQILGHSKLATTEHYVHYAEDVKEAYDRAYP